MFVRTLDDRSILQNAMGAWQKAEGDDARAECAPRLIADVCRILSPDRHPKCAELIADPKETLDQMVSVYRGVLDGGFGEDSRRQRAESAALEVLDKACGP